jgi:hypothetical protein
MFISILIVVLVLALTVSPVLIAALVTVFHLVARLRNDKRLRGGGPSLDDSLGSRRLMDGGAQRYPRPVRVRQ